MTDLEKELAETKAALARVSEDLAECKEQAKRLHDEIDSLKGLLPEDCMMIPEGQ